MVPERMFGIQHTARKVSDDEPMAHHEGMGRVRALSHEHLDELFTEASSEALTSVDEEESAAWWFIAMRCHLELLKRHTEDCKARCRRGDCPWWRHLGFNASGAPAEPAYTPGPPPP